MAFKINNLSWNDIDPETTDSGFICRLNAQENKSHRLNRFLFEPDMLKIIAIE